MQHVLKIAAYNWTSLLELTLLTFNQVEFMIHEQRSPDNFQDTGAAKATSPFKYIDRKKWSRDMSYLHSSIYALNGFRRRLGYFEDDIDRVIEQLTPQDAPSTNSPLALAGAIKDFTAISSRLRLYKARTEALSSTADDIVNLRSAAKSLEDSAFNLRLAIFIAIMFPATLVAALLSMGDGFKPGDGEFWIFWAAAAPLTVLMLLLVVGLEGSWEFLRGSIGQFQLGRGGKGRKDVEGLAD
jgi:hypothetical protein